MLAWIAIACLALPGGAFAQERSTTMEWGLGTGAAFINMVYGPVKVMYALLGGMTGGLAYVVTGGRTDVMMNVMDPAMRGDYAVTPEHLVGEKPLRFSGVAPESESTDY